ncbi:MAG: Npun_F0494 family protein [Phormidesmis sp.]
MGLPPTSHDKGQKAGRSSERIPYSPQAIRRAERAVRCSPFYPKLLAQMREDSVSVLVIADDSGMLKGYTQQPLSEMSAESELLWLVAVGILRREVDGQGLTDSFRLTPLGRKLVARWQSQGCPDWRANLVDVIKNTVLRRMRIPDWLIPVS